MPNAVVSGICKDGYEAVKQAFITNFEGNDHPGERDLGACVSVIVEGETVVDLWGGHLDLNRTIPWKEDTTICVFSVTKAVSSFCMYMLHDRKLIDFDEPVATYWPEFGQNGKETITIRMLLSHQAGLMYADDVPEGMLWEPGLIERALELKEPEWPPGTDAGYHSFTFGPIVQEVVKRVTGRSLGNFIRDEVAGPLGISFGIGLNNEENAKCAHFFGNDENGTLKAFRFDVGSIVHDCWKSLPRDEDFNSDNWRKREFASLNGHGNARALARLFYCIANGGEIDEVRLSSADTIKGAIQQHWAGIDRFGDCPGRFNAGFQMSNEYSPFGRRAQNFGFYGIGGSVGFCDPVNKVGFGYCCNRSISGAAGTSQLTVGLTDALYNVLARAERRREILSH